jgi:hypothetical protein
MLIIKVSIFSIESPTVSKGLSAVFTNELNLLRPRIILRAHKEGVGCSHSASFFA